ncbi:MAG TPA: rod shape-determining protein MreC [Bacteroidales bacterium]|nr:rod shape-determining protein MreC [Bacteroidales bacterium]HPT01997.1 rod shape-determining protein MreC [Bacteroidales bacterium]
MRNILAFIVRYHFLLLFVVLEAVAITMFVNSTYYQQSAVLNAGNNITGRFYTSASNVTGYFRLRRTNELLSIENSILRQGSGMSFLKNDTNTFWKNDTLYRQQYKYIVARVIHNSTNKRNNYIMLDKGRRFGIEKDMAVITPDGIAGTVVSVSENFAWVMSVLNKYTRISARIQKNNQMGTVVWNGVDYSIGTLTDIPAHVKLSRGDTIVTSGFSNIFPAGLMLGTIKDYRVEQGEHFYVIPFAFSVDFNSLDYVYVVKSLMKEEQDKLKETTEEQGNE